MIDAEKVERNVAEAAFGWQSYKKYGTRDKVITALLKRKGMADQDPRELDRSLDKTLTILKRARSIRAELLSGFAVRDMPYLEPAKFEQGRQLMLEQLQNEFPASRVTIQFALGMVWEMPYWR